MTDKQSYFEDRGESLSKQFSRFASRMKHHWNKQPVTLDDINTIKLPYAPTGTWDDITNVVSYFASRNEGGKWNITQKQVFGPEAEPISTTVARDLTLPETLDRLAELAPRAMLRETTKFWHPASVAKLIGHNIPGFGPEEVQATAFPPPPLGSKNYWEDKRNSI